MSCKESPYHLIIDEIHTIVGAVGTGFLDTANMLKPALSRGELQCIGATTLMNIAKVLKKMELWNVDSKNHGRSDYN